MIRWVPCGPALLLALLIAASGLLAQAQLPITPDLSKQLTFSYIGPERIAW